MTQISKSIICVLASTAVAGASALAAPALPGIVKMTQPDGTCIEVCLHGDEHCCYYTSPEGVLLEVDAEGFMREASAEAYARLDRRRMMRREIMRTSLNDGEVPTTGNLRGLVILAQFPDMPFAAPNDPEHFSRMLNEPGYDFNGATGSVADYYRDQSHGLFNITFDVAGPVTLPANMAFYGGDVGGATDINAYRMIQDACRLADEAGTDFSLYDNNDDGKVDLVYIIYSGYAQSNGASSDTVWPHMWFLSKNAATLELDGVTVDRYACSAERAGISGDTMCGIGLLCHEFSHTLGLPDIYDTSNTLTDIAMGEWDVMDLGCYNNATRTPAGYSSYEKSVLGWISPEEPQGLCEDLKLPALSSPDAKAIKLVNPSNPDEYFLLETRSRADKWDAALPGEGMLIIHVNYDKEVWDNNMVNSYGNHGVHLVPANGDFAASTDAASCPFPGSAGVTVWTDLTSLASIFADGSMLGRAVTSIRFDGYETTLDIGKSLPAPALTAPSHISATGFRANWENNPDARYYTLRIVAESTGEVTEYEKIGRNRFTLAGLEPEETYIYSVRAIGDVLVSPFSDSAEICPARAGMASVSAGSPELKGIYSSAGVCLGKDSSTLAPGIYILRYTDGRAERLLVK